MYENSNSFFFLFASIRVCLAYSSAKSRMTQHSFLSRILVWNQPSFETDYNTKVQEHNEPNYLRLARVGNCWLIAQFEIRKATDRICIPVTESYIPQQKPLRHESLVVPYAAFNQVFLENCKIHIYIHRYTCIESWGTSRKQIIIRIFYAQSIVNHRNRFDIKPYLLQSFILMIDSYAMSTNLIFYD